MTMDAWANIVASDKNRGKAIGLYNSSISIGFGVGPLIVAFYGSSGNLPVIICLILMSLRILTIIFIKKHIHEVNIPSQNNKINFSFVLFAPFIFIAIFVVCIPIILFKFHYYTLLEAYLPNIDTAKLSDHAVCMYTRTPDGNFIVGRDPRHSQVSYVCGLSGHGFKMSIGLGEILADFATDQIPDMDVDFLSPHTAFLAAMWVESSEGQARPGNAKIACQGCGRHPPTIYDFVACQHACGLGECHVNRHRHNA